MKSTVLRISVLIVVACLSLQASFTEAQEDFPLPALGRAPYAITASDFECSNFIKSMTPLAEWHISYLYHTFGNDNACLKRVLNRPELKTLQVHLINEVCLKHGRCGSYEFVSSMRNKRQYNRLWKKNSPRLVSKLRQFVKPLQKFLKKNLREDVTCLISPGLESGLSNEAAVNLIAAARPLFPECQIVWNPLRRARQLNGANYSENHGKRARPTTPCIVNTDGTDINFRSRKSVEKRNFESGVNGSKTWLEAGEQVKGYIEKYSYCDYIFLWVREDNCLPERSFRDPRARDCSGAKLTNSLTVNEIVKVLNSQ